MTDLAIKLSRLHNSSRRRSSPSFLRKIRAFARRETKPFSFAREITFNGSTPMIFWLRTKSQSKWKQRRNVKANEHFFLRRGVTSFFDRTKRNLCRHHSGVI